MAAVLLRVARNDQKGESPNRNEDCFMLLVAVVVVGEFVIMFTGFGCLSLFPKVNVMKENANVK
jgi:hypothetical protein